MAQLPVPVTRPFNEIKLKLKFKGARSVGKTSALELLSSPDMSCLDNATVEPTLIPKAFFINRIVKIDGKAISFTCTDDTGGRDLDDITEEEDSPTILKDIDVDGVVFMYDVTSDPTFKYCVGLVNKFRRCNVPFVVCANKIDLLRGSHVPTNQHSYFSENNIKYFGVSVKSDTNLREALAYLSSEILGNNIKAGHCKAFAVTSPPHIEHPFSIDHEAQTRPQEVVTAVADDGGCFRVWMEKVKNGCICCTPVCFFVLKAGECFCSICGADTSEGANINPLDILP